jgi:queuine/archaeosine tRNA-ribosyltransferase
MFEFKITAEGNRARAGIFATPQGEIQTPVFAPRRRTDTQRGERYWQLVVHRDAR